MSKRRQQAGGLAVLALGLGALAWVPSAIADPTQTALTAPVARAGYGISVSTTQVVVGDRVTVTVTAEDVSDLYSYDLRLAYDDRVLDYVDDSARTDLTGSTYGLDSDGVVEVVHTKLGTSPAATGAVTLAEATFTAVALGPARVSAVSLETVGTDLVPATTAGIGSAPVEVLAQAAPVATAAPTISGTAKVGRTLRASSGRWSVGGVALSYQWLRSGVPIAGATGTSYDLAPVDAGRKVDVVVSAAKATYVTGTAVATVGEVAKASTTTKVDVRGLVRAGAKAPIRISVGAIGLDPAGVVKVSYGGKVVKTGLRLRGGQASVRLPGRRAGSYRLTVGFLPQEGFARSSRTVWVRVR